MQTLKTRDIVYSYVYVAYIMILSSYSLPYFEGIKHELYEAFKVLS